MFTNAERQKERTGKYGTARDQYLQASFPDSVFLSHFLFDVCGASVMLHFKGLVVPRSL